MNKNPNYLYLTIGLLTAVVLVTSVHPQSLLMTVGVSFVALTFMVTSYFVIESRRQLLLAALLGMSALVPFLWLSLQRQGHSPSLLMQGLFVLNLILWLRALMMLRKTMIAIYKVNSSLRLRPPPVH